MQATSQYQSANLDEQFNQQQQWNQLSPDNQPAGRKHQGLDKQKIRDELSKLWGQIEEYKGTIAKISIAVVIVVALIGAGIALKGTIIQLVTAPVVETFDASSREIISGESATLQWNVTGMGSVSISPHIGAVSSSGSMTVSPDKTTTYTLVANNLFGSASGAITIKVREPAPSINSFSSNPGNIFAGQSSTLSWSVTNATSVSISPEIGTVSSSGTKSVTPRTTTAYTLTASNNAGNSTATAPITVTISDKPIITTFNISPAFINAGESSTLTWDIIGSESININQGIGGVGSKGSKIITPTVTTTYVLTAGAVTQSVTVTVDTTNVKSTTGSTIPTSVPKIGTFSASPDALTLGDNTTLSWNVTGVKSVSIYPKVGTFSSSGSTLVIPTENTTYTLSATNRFGTENATVTVTVIPTTDFPVPVIKSFVATPGNISAGGTSRLSWDVMGATTLLIDQGIGTPDPWNLPEVSPVETTIYTLTAINSSGTDSATVTVTVEP